MNHTDTSTDTGAPGEPRSPRRAFIPVLGFVCLLWAIELADSLAGLNLTRFGVYPRHVDGLAGVLWAPLIHGSWSHLDRQHRRRCWSSARRCSTATRAPRASWCR